MNNFPFSLTFIKSCKILSVATLVFITGTAQVNAIEGLRPAGVVNTETGISNRWINVNGFTNNADRAVINTANARSYLEWDSYGLAQGQSLQYIMPSENHISINRIVGGNQSVIDGRIEANGRLYLLNENGFLFGPNSVFNVNSLLASTLNFNMSEESLFASINDGTFNIASFINSQQPAFLSDGLNRDIEIQSGALIETQDGGNVFIFAANIFNQGDIHTRSGQTILAASDDRVYLTPSLDPALRGFLVEVDISDTVNNGNITNGVAGRILGERGNITLAGLAIKQDGVLEATTSVTENGSIRLLARHNVSFQDQSVVDNSMQKELKESTGLSNFSELSLGINLTEIETTRRLKKYAVATEAGDVQLGKNSQIRVRPDTTEAVLVPDAQLQKKSSVEITGRMIELKQDSSIVAENGQVILHAVINPSDTAIQISGDTGNLRTPAKASITLQKGSVIDVSGTTDNQLAMERNQLEVQLTGNFLRDAPLQREGELRNERILVDTRFGTALGDITDLLNSEIRRDVSERLSNGGNIQLISQGSVALNEKSQINIAAGSVTFNEGYVTTSQLVDINNNVIDVNDADPLNVYKGVYGTSSVSSSRWGQSQSWRVSGGGNTQFYDTYTQGQSGGLFNIMGHAVAANVNDVLIAGTVGDPLQRLAANRYSGGDFRLTLGGAVVAGKLAATQSIDIVAQRTQADIEQGQIDNYLSSGDGLWTLELDDDLLNSGVSHVSLSTSNGDITIAKDAQIKLASQGSFSAMARNIMLEGDISISSGDVALKVSPFRELPVSLSGVLKVNGRVDVGGSWTNDNPQLSSFDPGRALDLAGGSIKLSAKNNADLILTENSELAADGGGWLQSNGDLQVGDGGKITIAVSTDIQNESDIPEFRLKGAMHAYAAGKGGALNIMANRVRIADKFKQPAEAGELQLTSGFFSSNGFTQYTIKSNLDDLIVRSDAVIYPKVDSLVLNPGFNLRESSASLNSLTRIEQFAEEYLRPATSLNLLADQSGSGLTGLSALYGSGLNIESGANIQLDPGADLNLSAVRNLFMNGDIRAPGGDVNIALLAEASLPAYLADQAIWIAGNIDVSGTFIRDPINDLGLLMGTILDSGSIKITANSGYVIQDRASALNVSGQLFEIDYPSRMTGNAVLEYSATSMASDAGTLDVTAAEGVHLMGSLNGHAAAVSGAQGGRLAISLTPENRKDSDGDFADPARTTESRVIHIVQGQVPENKLLTVLNPGEKIDDSFIGEAWLSADKITDAGFDSLILRTNAKSNQVGVDIGRIEFHNNIDLTLGKEIQLLSSLIRGNGDIGDSVNLNAPYLLLGSDLLRGIESAAMVGVEASAGNARLNLSAGRGADTGLLDIVSESVIQGFKNVSLSSNGDIRLRGQRHNNLNLDQRLTGSLTTRGDLSLTANQVYATTMSQFDLSVSANPNGVLRINAGKGGSAVLSAGSQLTLNAPVIQQAGILKAPFGSILLNADEIILEPGSITSTSAENQLIPLGRLYREESWIYPVNVNDINNFISSVPDRRVVLQADDISYAEGSIVDISGGGDLYAWEFLPGIGGSVDNLLPENAEGAFAVIPGFSDYAPFDHFSWQGAGIDVGKQVHLQASNLLPEGDYTVLPARYALMPGAYLITPQKSTIYSQQRFTRPDGTPIVAGQMAVAGTSFQDDRYSAYLIETGDQVRLKSEYSETTATDFFTAEALRNNMPLPTLPADAGSLDILAGQNLDLAGAVRSDIGPGGRGSQVNIAGDHLRVVNVKDNAGGIELRVANLSNLNADSLLLGGVRERTDKGTKVTVSASQVDIEDMRDDPLTADVDESVSLQVADLILAATDAVTVHEGADIRATQPTAEQDRQLIVNGDGALLRVSNSSQVDITRKGNAVPASGALIIASGSVIEAGQSMLFDASINTQIDGQLVMKGGSLNLGASRISLGGVGATGLSLTENDFASLSLDELVLTSRSSVDLYGFNQSFDKLRINAAALDGYGTDASSLTAAELVLTNIGGFTADNTADFTHTGTGDLSLNAQSIGLEKGDFEIRGFKNLNMAAVNDLTMAANGSLKLDLSANAVIDAGRITALGGINYAIDAGNSTLTTLNSTTSTVTDRAIGAQLTIKAGQIVHGGFIDLASGDLNMQAEGSGAGGNLQLANGSVINMSGIERDFADSAVYSSGGMIKLVSKQGAVNMDSQAVINVSGGAGQSNAGAIGVSAIQGNINLSGQLIADHSKSGGRFVSDSNSISSLSVLNSALNTSGFTGKRHIRLRTGNIELAANDAIIAEDVLLQSDAGSVLIAGHINAAAEKGGRVQLAARDNIELSTGSLIDASAKSVDEDGGVVFMETKTGQIDLALGSVINVSGNEKGGSVHFRAPRTSGVDTVLGTADDDINISQIAAKIQGFDELTLEGCQAYDIADGNLAATDWAAPFSDASNFMDDSNIGNIFSRLNLSSVMSLAEQDKVHIRPGIEFTRSGDLTVSSAIDLLTQRYVVTRTDSNGDSYQYNEPGIISFVADGNLIVNRNISDGVELRTTYKNFASKQRESLPMQPAANEIQGLESWDYRFIAGHDNKASSVLSVVDKPESNNLSFTLANNTHIRTGTGNIDIIAANNISLGRNSAVYTVGRSTGRSSYDLQIKVWGFPSDTSEMFALPGVVYPDSGGDINLIAGGNIDAAPESQFVNDWLHRVGGDIYTGWGINIDSFNDGVAALGGGDIRIDSAGDISHLNISIPTTGKQVGEVSVLYQYGSPSGFSMDGPSVIEQRGSGDILLNSGGNLNHGVLYAGNGDIDVDVKGSIGDAEINSGLFILAEETRVNISAVGDVNFQGVANPSLLPMSRVQTGLLLTPDVFFSTYSELSNINLLSLGGDINLENRIDLEKSTYSTVLTKGRDDFARRYPANLSAIAMSGDINMGNKSNVGGGYGQFLSLMPAANGSLQLLAQDSISAIAIGSSDHTQLSMLDIDLASIPDIYNTVEQLDLPVFNRVDQALHADTPVHINDVEAARIVANQGDILSVDTSRGFRLDIPKQLEMRAGQDIVRMDLRIQHNNDENISLVEAGQDIRYSVGINAQDKFRRLQIAGPGELHVLAGRDIELSDQKGIRAIGNDINPALSDQGAKLYILAGLGDKGADLDGFTASYFSRDSLYADLLMDKMATADFDTALQAFNNLSDKEQRSFVLNAYFNELRESAQRAAREQSGKIDQNDSDRFGYSRGLDAFATLFPGSVLAVENKGTLREGESIQLDNGSSYVISASDIITTGGFDYIIPEKNLAYDGNVRLIASSIHGDDNGSDIAILVPGGFLNVGLAIEGVASDAGILTRGNGDINLFVHDDVSVNESRVQALNGGDITIWSNVGDVDAGRGAKSAFSAPTPRVVFGLDGIKLEYKVGPQGSGIQALTGNAVIAAVSGVIDAGDAGITTGGDLILATDTVLNAGQIEAGGDSVGVPADMGGVAVDLGSMDTSNSSGDGAKQTELIAQDASDQFGEASIAILRVEVIDLEEDGLDVIPDNSNEQSENNNDKNAANNPAELLETSMVIQH